MDNWIEVNVAVTHEAVEVVSEILTEAGSKGVAIEDPQLINDLRNSGTWELCDIPEQQNTEVVTVSGYYADDEKLQERLAQIEAELEAIEERIGQYRFGNTRFRKLSEQDWANEWKQIDPGMAFGTGTHHTTNMMMERLEKVMHQDALVFDVGTGSGILAIAAALCGAKEVKAVDIDGVAVRVAQENVANNHLSDKIEVREGDLLHGTEGKADIIIANIIADIIIMLLPDIPGKLKDDGIFLASGIIEERREDVEAAAAEQGLKVDAVDRRGGWVVMQFSKK